jgi:hypothetical protein
MPPNTLTTFQAVQRVLADVTGMKAVHGVTPPTTGTGANSVLRPATDVLSDSPVIVAGSGGVVVDFETHTRLRLRWTLTCAVWRLRSRDATADAYDALVGDIARIITAIAARGKAYSIDPGVAMFMPESFGPIDGAEWPVGSDIHYFVLPFDCEIVGDWYDVATTPA